MRVIASAIVVLLFAALASAEAGDALKFEYFAAGGQPVFESGATLDPMVLVEVEHLGDAAAQNKILDSLDAESLRLRFIIACTSEVPRDRYATSRTSAQQLRAETRGFRVTLLGPGGAILVRSAHPLTAAKITAEVE